MAMLELMDKLKSIELECDPDAAKKKKKDKKPTDEFAEKKNEIQDDLKQIRKDLKERDELILKSPQSKASVEAAAKVRSAIIAARDEAEVLSEIQKRQAKKTKKGDAEAIIAHRKEVVDLIFKHIEELERLEKARPQQQEETKNSLFGGKKSRAQPSSDTGPYTTSEATGGGAYKGGSYIPEEGGLLPDIDEGLRKLEQKNKIIDSQLEEVEQGVLALKNLATQMGEHVDQQNVMIDDITATAEKANAHLRETNTRLKNALDKVRKPDRFIIDFILIIVLLAIATYIYEQLK